MKKKLLTVAAALLLLPSVAGAFTADYEIEVG